MWRETGLRLAGALCHNGEVIAEEVQLFGVLPSPESDAVYFSLRADENGGFSTLMKWDGHTASVISEKTGAHGAAWPRPGGGVIV